jgi:hypothetical protein
MPLFGSRMVCQTASYKYIEERDRKFAERENKLARYVRDAQIKKASKTGILWEGVYSEEVPKLRLKSRLFSL